MPGVGKSTLGKKLAAQLNWDFTDLDQLIVRETGKEIEDLFAAKGENYFRSIEAKVLRQNLPSGKIIVSCGGGTPVYEDNLNWMKKEGFVIYLNGTSNFIFSRNNHSTAQRPLFKGLNELQLFEKIEELLKIRSPFYEQAHEKIKLPLKSIKIIKSLVELRALLGSKNEE
jgi:shikimate kinase